MLAFSLPIVKFLTTACLKKDFNSKKNGQVTDKDVKKERKKTTERASDPNVIQGK